MTKERSVALFGFRHLAHAPHSSNCQDDFAAAHIQQHDAQFALMLVIADALVGDHLASSTVRSFSLHEGSRDAFLTESMPRRSKITMDHVARAAGVSKQTISAVINNKSGISEKTRVRVRQIIARLDYQPNMLAGSLRAQRSFTVGVVVPSINNPFYPELVRGIEDEAQRYSYSVFLCNSDENPEKELNYLTSYAATA